MSLRSKIFISGAALLFSASMAFGAITASDLAAQFQTNGYTFIQIKTGLTQIKVQAVKDGVRVETIYDIATGDVLSTHSRTVGTIASTDPGVVIRVLTRDFLEPSDGTEDHGPDGVDDDHGADHSGAGTSDDSADDLTDDSNDDHGGGNSGGGNSGGGNSGGGGDHGGDDD